MTNPTVTVTKNAVVLTALRVATPAVSMIVVLAVSRMLEAKAWPGTLLALTLASTTLTPLGSTRS
jgi:hypothetical protein